MTDQKEKPKKGNASKKKSLKGVRNVLTLPYDNFWPVINKDSELELKEKLKQFLIPLKRTQTKIPWKELKKLSKEERIIKKKSLLNNDENAKRESSQYIIFGVNAVTRQLEKDNVCSILLDSTVDPPMLIKHILMMAANKKVPVLLVPFLSSVMLEVVNFSAIALALKKADNKSPTSEFHELHEDIIKICNTLGSPEIFIPSVQTKKSEVTALSDDNKVECEVKNSLEVNKIALSTNVYLYRNSKSERVFVPAGYVETKSTTFMEVDFIAMPSDDEFDVNEFQRQKRYHDCNVHQEKEEDEKEDDDENYYVPLKVKRIQGNPNRVKATKLKSKKKVKKNKT